MKKRNIIIYVLCALLCFGGVVFIFQKYRTWTDDTFDRLVEQNLESYTEKQTTEVAANVGKVQAALKAAAELMGKSEKDGIDPSEYEDYLQALSDNKGIDAIEVAYFRFDELNVAAMRENDQQLIEKLQNGEPALSDIYPYSREGKSELYYGIAEPVKVNGEYIGFVRGLIDPQTLLYTSQIGVLKDETESYLIHSDGTNAMLDYSSEEEQVNMLDVIKMAGGDQKTIRDIEEGIKEDKKQVIQIYLEDQLRYISYTRLPYNDLIILNITDPVELNTYTDAVASNGRKMMLLFFLLAVIVVSGIIVAYYMSSKERRFEQRRTDLLVNFGDTILCEYDMKRDVLQCTSNITKLFALDSTIIKDFREYLSHSEFVFHEDLQELTKLLDLHLNDNQVVSREIRLLSRSGGYLWCRLDITGVGDTKEDRLVVKVSDISQDKERELGLLRKVRIDNLTGVLSREAFEENVKKLLKKSKDGYMVLLDLDNFKDINDVYGHLAGDECLQKVGEVFAKAFRVDDLVGRYGGDEFFAYMTGTMPRPVIEKRIQSLTEMLDQIRVEDIPQIRITCSIGIVRCTEDCTYEGLIKRADETMYQAKKQGKNSCIIQ